ncbi:TPA: ead/Ea22-like family protein [Raoultella ornithinolytica]|uniref:ead/Ea22-like family protein n=1 Tax=Raoultella planticola TaxID=575 RepID=UPI000D82DAEE|nr:ead/Ea22-like family protein [Raoultella planticola]SPZ32235.1 Uncharacterised protein [Raoultella planticola]HEQ2046431.1 ead/Ea22-like family protein [Raoultella ornithinolytica]
MTTDITELAQSLKAAAEKATPGPWGVARDGKTLVSNQSHPIATVSDAMHRMLADGSTGKDAEFIALANPANVKRLVEALEKAQRANAAQDDHINQMAKRIRRLEIKNTGIGQHINSLNRQIAGKTEIEQQQAVRIAELEREQEHLRVVGVMSEKAFHRLENRESRFIALWPRPEIYLPRKRPEDGVIVYARTAAAAGIKREAE